MKVVDLASDLEDEYERFVLAHPCSLVYYSLRFRDFLTELLGCRPRYTIALDNNGISAVLPLMRTDGRYGQVLNSLPYYGTNGGVLATDLEAEAALVEHYRLSLNDAAVAAATVIENPLQPGRVAIPHDLVDTRIGHITLFEGNDSSPDEQLARLIDGSARRNVRKAGQSGVDVAVENESFAELEALHRASMAAAGGQAKSWVFFEAVAAHFRPGTDFDVYVARIAGHAVAALLLFYYGTTVDYYVPALHPDFRPAQPMAAVLHTAMTDAIARGFRRWSWGGSWTSHDSLIRFKEKWGGRGRTYAYRTAVKKPELRSSTSAELLEEYQGFYVLPFSALAARGADVSA